MILAIVLADTPVRTRFGLECRVSVDVNPDAKAISGSPNEPAIANVPVVPGDRVVLEYRRGPSYGLWFIVARVSTSTF